MKKIALLTGTVLGSIFLFGYSSAMNIKEFLAAARGGKTEVVQDFIGRCTESQLIKVHQEATCLIRQCT